ncbi:hypothetical protein AGMMS50212_17270 [Spirochaetia bacterium]|nr:hypothetical protein AGMMS50212_17270 [Spirochaetia bacterium]
MSQTSKKVKTLVAQNEDFRLTFARKMRAVMYPTIDEILEKMNDDLHHLFVKENLSNGYGHNRCEK